MITRRLAESVLFLEARCKSDADREYMDAIRRVIEEHALLREMLEKIRFEKNPENISELIGSTLRQTSGSSIDEDMTLRETLARLAELLPSDEQLKEMTAAKSMIREALE